MYLVAFQFYLYALTKQPMVWGWWDLYWCFFYDFIRTVLPIMTTPHSNVYIPLLVVSMYHERSLSQSVPLTCLIDYLLFRFITYHTYHIQGNWDENITSKLYGIRHLSNPLSRANVYIQCGRKNAPRMKPSTYPNSAKAGHHGDITFYEQKIFFQKTKIFPSSFSTSQFLIFTTETGWKLST